MWQIHCSNYLGCHPSAVVDLAPDERGDLLIPGAMSTHDEQTLALIRNGRSVSAIKFLRDNTGCDLSAAKEMVEHMYASTHRPLGRPCPSCGVPLRTPRAKLCTQCGARIGQ